MKQLFILWITVTVFAACSVRTDGVKELSQQDLLVKLQEENVLLIDVRTPLEVASGHIPEAAFFIDVNEASFEEKIAALDTTKIYVIYCRSGTRSSIAASYMSDNGFPKVYNLDGGILGFTGQLK